jgi:hypothetical protein
MFQRPTLIIAKYLSCLFVTNAISEVHGYALFWSYIQKVFSLKLGLFMSDMLCGFSNASV